MSHSYEQVRQIASELPREQRIQLANSLLEGVDLAEDNVSANEVDTAWDAEIGLRVSAIKTGSAVTYSQEEVEAELRAIVRK
jgi:hypothetical protein